MTTPHFNLIIIGAGLSGIGSACHIAREYPDRSLALIERRENVGGPWDLFRYTGIRSDSDMASFGYNFKPWYSDQVLAKGGDIREYVKETAKEFGLYDKIHYGLQITGADWSTEDNRWTLTAHHEKTGETRHFTCDFMLNCAGYYNFDQEYRPSFKGEADFQGCVSSKN